MELKVEIGDILKKRGWTIKNSNHTLTGGHCFVFEKNGQKYSVAIEEIDEESWEMLS